MQFNSGIHNQNPSIRSRVFYLFHRFVKECRNDIPIEIVVDIVESIRDLLQVHMELPEVEGLTQQEFLDEAMANPGIFDAQLYLYETVGILVSLLFKTPDQLTATLLSIVKPL